jgi:hypothetical protein
MAIPPQTKEELRGKPEKEIILQNKQVLTTNLWLRYTENFW